MLSLEFQAGGPEIEEQADFQAGSSQVIDELHLVLLYKCPDGLDLDDHPALRTSRSASKSPTTTPS